jgi:hypothetical protein
MESAQERLGPMEAKSGEPTLQASEGREQYRGIPSDSMYDRPEKSLCSSSPISLQALQGADTDSTNGESRGWEQEEKSSRQSQSRDAFRADDSRLQNRTKEPMGRGQSSSEGFGWRNYFDSGRVLERECDPSGTSQQAQPVVPVDIKNSERRAESKPGRANCGLFFSAFETGRQEEQFGAISLIICGGESGRGARPMKTDWARSARDQCVGAEVPFFFKQHGEYGPDVGMQNMLKKMGKKAAGCLLDGREWKEFPKVQAE